MSVQEIPGMDFYIRKDSPCEQPGKTLTAHVFQQLLPTLTF